MRKFGYMLYHPDSPHILEEVDYLTSKGCSAVFMDPYNPKNQYPQFETVLSNAKPNDVLVVRDLSYLTTSFKPLMNVVRILKERSVHLVCIDQNINTKLQDIDQLQYVLKTFYTLLIREKNSKQENAIEKNKRAGKQRISYKGMREKTYNKAIEVNKLVKKGELSKKEIIELLNINANTFQRYRLMEKKGQLTPDNVYYKKSTK